MSHEIALARRNLALAMATGVRRPEPLRTLEVYQDGAEFYMYPPGDDRFVKVITYPFGPVKDFDMPKANAARKWFTGTYCPRFNINPQFV